MWLGASQQVTASTSMNMSASDKVAEPARVILDMTMLSHVTVLRPSAFYRDRTPPVVWSHTAEEDARRSFLVARTTVTLCCTTYRRLQNAAARLISQTS